MKGGLWSSVAMHKHEEPNMGNMKIAERQMLLLRKPFVNCLSIFKVPCEVHCKDVQTKRLSQFIVHEKNGQL